MSLDYDRLAIDYSRHRRLHPGVLQEILHRARPGPSHRVLEVGSGTGSYSAALVEATGCTSCGVDPSRRMQAAARRDAAVLRILGRAEALPLRAGSFDLVFSVDVVHHLGSLAAYFREARRVLAPGGRLCTVTDSKEIIENRRPLARYFPETVGVDLRRYPSIETIRRVTVAAGLLAGEERTVTRELLVTDAGPYEAKALSCLHLIPEEAFRRGLRRMREDLAAGPLPGSSAYAVLWAARSD